MNNTYILPPQIKHIAKYIWLCPPPLFCLLHINVTYTQSPTTPHWPCKVHTHTHQPIPIPQYLFTTNTTATTHTPYTPTKPPTPPRTHPNTSHSHPLHTHTVHTYTTPNTLICTPSTHKHKTLHYNIFKVSNLRQYAYCIAVPLQLLSTNTWTLS